MNIKYIIVISFTILLFLYSFAWAEVSYTSIPSKIQVGLTGVLTVDEWNNNGNSVEDVIEVDLKEYIKDVMAEEWYTVKDENDQYQPAHAETIKTGAVVSKIFAWWRINIGWRHYIDKEPDVVDNTADQVYIPSTCAGQNTSACKGKTSKRVQNGTADQAVDETWNTVLKRKDCFTNITSCSNVFQIMFNKTQLGCDAKNGQYTSFCLPQTEANNLAKNGKTWKEILTTYYAPIKIYEQQAFAVGGMVEVVSSCIEIRRDSGNLRYKCGYEDSNDDTSPIKKFAYDREDNIPAVCQNDVCPEEEQYLLVGMQGVIQQYTETMPGKSGGWWKIKWQNQVVGWSGEMQLAPGSGFIVDVNMPIIFPTPTP